jgi:hypothetical protein
MQDMVQDHKETVADFRKEAEYGQDQKMARFKEGLHLELS